ncbi:MAG: translation initiation factor IF-2 subunit gamma [Nitrososphaerota archaeon]|nr:translation initiation factor IF-2 subunit gamma [Nitrososphaerota archaeon]
MAQQSTTAQQEPAVRRIPKQPECNIGTAGHVDSGKCNSWDSYVLVDGVPLTGEQIFQKVRASGVLASRVDGGEVYAFQGNEVVSIDADFQPVRSGSVFYVQPYRGPMFTVRGKTGREVKVTPEHPLLINRRGVVQWMKAREIEEGDYAAFMVRVPLQEGFSVLPALEELKKSYATVSAEDYESLRRGTDGFTDLTSLSTAEIEKVRILAGLGTTALCRLSGVDSAEYALRIRSGRRFSAKQRERVLRVLEAAKKRSLKPNEFLAERDRPSGRRIRLVRAVPVVDEDVMKWFAFVWSKGRISKDRVDVTQTVQGAMLREFLSISTRKLGLDVESYPEGRYAIHNGAFVDYLRVAFGFNPGEEPVHGIADWVCKVPQGLKAVFLRRFFTLEGEFDHEKGEIAVAQLDDRSVTIISYLLHSFGIVPKFGAGRSPTTGGARARSRLTVSGRQELEAFATSIGFDDPESQRRLTTCLSTIEREGEEADRSIPIDVGSLRSLLRDAGLVGEGTRRGPSPGDVEPPWYRAYADGLRNGRMPRSELLLVIRTLDGRLSRIEQSLGALRSDGPTLRRHASLIGLSPEELAAETGSTRKKVTRVLRRGSNEELRPVALFLRGETRGLLNRCLGRLEQLRRLASSSVSFDEIVAVAKEDYDGLVFDLSVPGYANFVAGKGATICHNTSIVQAITGVWASAHSEELKRGITIKVGYADAAFYRCPVTPPPEAYSTSPVCPVCGSETTLLRAVSFVDAPGHESLMTNMLAGAALMDGVILVITANEPVPMPQTREHLLALQMLGMKKMVVVQNKIDRVDTDGARKNYDAIKKFLANTVGADAPIIPVSAQNRINIDALIEALEEYIPTPKHDLSANPKMLVLRSFDVNRPGADVKSLVGGVLGGTLVSGEVRVGDEIEISPGVAEERSGKYTPILTKVASLGTGAGMSDRVGPGGLIALGTNLDPRLTKGDVLVGNLVGKPGTLQPALTHVTIDLQLFEQAVGSSGLIKVEKLRPTETLRLNIGTASTLGTVTSARESVAELDLKKPVVTEAGGRVAISRRIAERWRLIGSGVIR